MPRHLNRRQRAWCAALALVAAQVAASGALAQKEQFQRTKPHVNIGTIGNTQPQSGNLAGQAAEIVCPEPGTPLPPGATLPEECVPPRQAVGGSSPSPPPGNR